MATGGKRAAAGEPFLRAEELLLDVPAKAVTDPVPMVLFDEDREDGLLEETVDVESRVGRVVVFFKSVRGASLGSFCSFFTISIMRGKASPLFACKCSMPALLSSFKSTMVSILIIVVPFLIARATMFEGKPVVSWVPMMSRTSHSSVAASTLLRPYNASL